MSRTKEEYNAYMRDYMLARYYSRRAYYIDLLGGKCSNCNSVDNLEFDHVNADAKSFEYGQALGSMAEERLAAEMQKAQLLCSTCHDIKSIQDMGNQQWCHGTLSGYRHCKCDRCKLAKAQYMYEYNLNLQIQNGEVSVTYIPA